MLARRSRPQAIPQRVDSNRVVDVANQRPSVNATSGIIGGLNYRDMGSIKAKNKACEGQGKRDVDVNNCPRLWTYLDFD